VRYINDKILADLEYILALFPEVFTRKRLEGWKNDFYQWMIDGYASAININFYEMMNAFMKSRTKLGMMAPFM